MKTASPRRKLKSFVMIPAIIALAGLFTYVGLYALDRSLPEPEFSAANVLVDSGKKPSVTWPNYGQSAIATKSYGVVATNGDTEAQPTASVAKLITALAIMKKQPFTDQKGGTITFTNSDVASYQSYVDGGGTVAMVEAGLEWTHYQALEAILLASANNVSDSMVISVFGSLDNYRDFAQKMVKDLGMINTTIGVDASGYDPSTKSTAHDMAILALEALDDPMIRQIVSQGQADLPVAGRIENTNKLLADTDIIGMKTGWTPEAGGTFVLAGTQYDGDLSQQVVAVVMGNPDGPGTSAQNDAYELFKSAKQNFTYRELISKDEVLGRLNFAWSEQLVSVRASDSIGEFMWADEMPEVRVRVDNNILASDKDIGQVVASFGDWQKKVPLELSQSMPEPSLWWRLAGRYLSD